MASDYEMQPLTPSFEYKFSDGTTRTYYGVIDVKKARADCLIEDRRLTPSKNRSY